MIKSLKDWLENTVDMQKCLSTSGVGDAVYDKAVQLSCYITSKITTVVNAQGREQVSNIQLYLDGELDVVAALTDRDRFVLNNKVYGVKAFGDFYENGTLSLRVVYV